MPDEPPGGRSAQVAPASEGEALAVIAAELRRCHPGGVVDLEDDCARLSGPTALVTTDALIEGVHFDPRWDTDAQIGAQAAVANLSDLAASGGAAGWLVWAVIAPPGLSAARLRGLTRGFAETAAAYGARVVGGNLSVARAPLTLAVTAGGPLAGRASFHRGGARPGDSLYVTGPLGDAALGVASPDAETRAARHGWRPALAEAAALARWGRVTAAMDVSDGLLLDAARLGAASGVAVHLDSDAVPVSALYRRRCGTDRALALRGGEDYVLLFSAPAGADPWEAWGTTWRVGECRAGSGVSLDGQAVAAAGFDHFGHHVFNRASV